MLLCSAIECYTCGARSAGRPTGSVGCSFWNGNDDLKETSYAPLLSRVIALLALLGRPASAVLIRVSVGDHGQQGNFEASNCLLSGDGHYVFFDSGANNLITGDTNVQDDIFVRDLVTGTTTRVSVTPDGSQLDATLFQLFHLCGVSSDGRYVAMCSEYSLETGLQGSGMLPYLKDTVTGAVEARGKSWGITPCL